jgi:hypothetical protein
MYSQLTNRTIVAGTPDGARRVLERVRDGRVQVALPADLVEALATNWAKVALVADLASQPNAPRVAWLDGMRTARLLADFRPPGMNVEANVTYGEPSQAQAAANRVRSLAAWVKGIPLLGGGVQLRDLEVARDRPSLVCTFTVDDQTLRTLASFAPRLLPALSP